MKFENLKIGEVLGEIQFYKVEAIKGDRVDLKNDDGETIQVTKAYVEKLLNSASQFDSTESLTRTELVDKFLSSARTPITVNFNKQVKPADVKKAIADLYPNKGGKLMSEDAFKKAVAKAIDLKGEERTMVGRHYGTQDANGRVSFVDMEVETKASGYDARMRLVDPRTLNYLIVGGVKYEVKK